MEIQNITVKEAYSEYTLLFLIYLKTYHIVDILIIIQVHGSEIVKNEKEKRMMKAKRKKRKNRAQQQANL